MIFEAALHSGGQCPAPDARLADSAESPIDAFDGQWSVLHTMARNEKALAADLSKRGIGFFLPLAHVRRRYGGRSVHLRIPLFPGYLFLCGGIDERYVALTTHRVANVLEVLDQEGLKADLRQIYRTVCSDVPVDLYPGIRRGRRCRVTGGSLRGLEGVVLRRRDLCRVYLAVAILGQSAEVELDPGLLEIIE